MCNDWIRGTHSGISLQIPHRDKIVSEKACSWIWIINRLLELQACCVVLGSVVSVQSPSTTKLKSQRPRPLSLVFPFNLVVFLLNAPFLLLRRYRWRGRLLVNLPLPWLQPFLHPLRPIHPSLWSTHTKIFRRDNLLRHFDIIVLLVDLILHLHAAGNLAIGWCSGLALLCLLRGFLLLHCLA